MSAARTERDVVRDAAVPGDVRSAPTSEAPQAPGSDPVPDAAGSGPTSEAPQVPGSDPVPGDVRAGADASASSTPRGASARRRRVSRSPRSSRAPRSRRAARAWTAAVVLIVAVIAVVLVSAAIGQFATTPRDVIGSVWRVLIQGADPLSSRVDAALWTIRFPRTVLALLVGACLAVAGTVMQGVFANPLAEPSIIGVSSGASVGACLVIVFGAAAVAPWTLPAAAFAGALVVTAAVWALSHAAGRAVVLTLVLTGIAVNAIAGAATSFLVFLGDTSSREQIIFWQMGTLGNASWRDTGIVVVVFVMGLVCALAMRSRLDVLSLGDRSAQASGVHVERLRVLAIVLVCILTGAAVAFAGIIAFVGLIVPHTLRLVVGPSHRYLVPLSALGGAVLLGVADIAARTVIPFGDLPVGIFTALVGGPLFLVLLRRTLKRSGATA